MGLWAIGGSGPFFIYPIKWCRSWLLIEAREAAALAVIPETQEWFAQVQPIASAGAACGLAPADKRRL
jgi:hypothetical protein